MTVTSADIVYKRDGDLFGALLAFHGLLQRTVVTVGTDMATLIETHSCCLLAVLCLPGQQGGNMVSMYHVTHHPLISLAVHEQRFSL